MRILFALPVLLLGTTARADDKDDPYIPIDMFPSVGAGIGPHGFDGDLRWGLVTPVTYNFRPGAYLDLHTTGDFDPFDASVGAQVQVPLHDSFGLQLRGGIGVTSNGVYVEQAGVAVGSWLAGANVTARRFTDDNHFEVAVNFDVNAVALVVLPFLPFMDWPRIE